MTPRGKLTVWMGAGSVAALLTLTATREGTVLHAYRDPVGILTACTGETHYVSAQGDIVPGATFTPDQCADALLRSLWAHAEPVIRCTQGAELTPGMKIAFTDFSYNAGGDTFCKSSMARRAVAGDRRGACDAILLYRFAGGRDCSVRSSNCYGVWSRRQEQHKVCMEGLA